jgi:hypothetical protein
MSSLFLRVLARLEKARRPSRAARRSARPELEWLETRLNPSLVGSEIHVNVTTGLDQTDPDVASNRSGTTVVVWTHQFSATDKDVHARVYDAAGTPLTGIIDVAISTLNETKPAVAIDDDGRFLVVWTHKDSGGDKGIQGRWYDSDGTPRTTPFTVADSPSEHDYDPDVAVRPTNTMFGGIGDAVVSYTQDFSATDKDVRIVRFLDGSTTPIANSNVRIGTGNGDQIENKSSVARDNLGRFSVAYQDALFSSPSNTNVRLARFNNSGTQLLDVQLAGAGFAESNPSVGMDDAGTSFVAWQQQNSSGAGGWNIRVRKVLSNNTVLSAIPIASTSAAETLPAIAVERDASDYVVAYQSSSGGVSSVKVNERLASDTDAGTHSLGSSRTRPSIGLDDNQHYFLAFQKAGDAFDPGKGIFAGRGLLD